MTATAVAVIAMTGNTALVGGFRDNGHVRTVGARPLKSARPSKVDFRAGCRGSPSGNAAPGAFRLDQQKNPQREVDPHREKHQHTRKRRQRALPPV
jgi:hypothetical protein